MSLSPSELVAATELHPEVAAFARTHPQQPMDNHDPNVIRRAFASIEERIFAKAGPTPADVSESEQLVPMRDGYQSKIRIYKPTSLQAGPLIILGHAGGFVSGSVGQTIVEARALVQLFGASVVAVSFRLAPENQFPTAQLDVWDSCKWIAANATGELIGADPAKGFILGGASVGGSMAAALSRKFQVEPLAWPLTGQWLAIPSLMDDSCVPLQYKDRFVAREQSENAPILNKAGLAALQRWSEWDSASDLRYAVNSKTDIAHQPKTYLQVDGLDPYRDDALIYNEMLRRAGVSTRLDFYAGCPHLHWLVLYDLKISQQARVDTILGFGWLLGSTVSRAVAARALGLDPLES